MSARGRDGSERLLAIATAGLPSYRSEWGAAMRAELASIDDPGARRRFARSAARTAFSRGLGVSVGLGLLGAVLVAVAALTASRLQLANGGPGVLEVTVPVPAFILLLVALASAGRTRSFRTGLTTGILALAASFVGLSAVLAVEGMVWMDRHGVFLLDGDPPRGHVRTEDVVFNIFSTGLWAGHAILWLPGVLIGAVLGAWIAGPPERHEPAPAEHGRC
jgi:hypothetical protein